MKILLGDFNAKVGREDIFKPTVTCRVYATRIYEDSPDLTREFI
jgi:hypothetical protein